MLEAAIVIAALCVPGSVLLWRLGGLWQQTEVLGYKREKNAEALTRLDANAKADRDALMARIEALEAFKTRAENGLELRRKSA